MSTCRESTRQVELKTKHESHTHSTSNVLLPSVKEWDGRGGGASSIAAMPQNLTNNSDFGLEHAVPLPVAAPARPLNRE